MSLFENSPAVIIEKRLGTEESPYIPVEESLIINTDGKVLLSEIPFRFNRVEIVDDFLWVEIDEGLPNESQYKVDYLNKIITFNISNIGKQLNFKYMGMGNHYYSTKSIYTATNNGKVTETLYDVIETGRASIENLRDVNSAIENSEVATNNAITQANFAKEQGEIAKTNAELANQASTQAEITITNANLKIVEIDGKLVEANTVISNANTSISNMDLKITEVNGKIEEINTAKTNSEIATLEAQNATQAAQQVITNTNTVISEAQTATANANNAATNANTEASNLTQLKTDVQTATTNANSAKNDAQLATTHARDQGNYAKTQGDYAKLQGDRAKDIADGTGILTQTDIGVLVAGFNEFGQVLDKSGNVVEGKVKSINGKEGAVTLTATDVGATPTIEISATAPTNPYNKQIWIDTN